MTVYREFSRRDIWCLIIVVFREYKLVNLYHVSTHLQLLPFDQTLKCFSHLDSTMEETFEMESCIKGYHVYKEVWMSNGEEIIFY